MKARRNTRRIALTGGALAALLSLNACGAPMAVPWALSAAGGAISVLKDVLELDVSMSQSTPGKTPIVPAALR